MPVRKIKNEPHRKNNFKPGYHLKQIPKGKLGDLSKIQEELDEAKDAEDQGIKLMLLIELSDMIGAIKAVAEKNGSSLNDLIKMQEVTERAFKSGHRR